MLALLQRVSEAAVRVDGVVLGAIGPGLLALVAIEPGDTEAQLHRLAIEAGLQVVGDQLQVAVEVFVADIYQIHSAWNTTFN